MIEYPQSQKEKVSMKVKKTNALKKLGINHAENAKFEKIDGVWYMILNGKMYPFGANKDKATKENIGKIEELIM